MSRGTQIKLLLASVIPLGLGMSIASSSETAAQSVSAFKLSGVVTDCVVPRIAESASSGATATVGPAGGEVLTDDEATVAYRCARSAMVAAYTKSGNANARDYSTWTVYSKAPYISATHGNRLVTNYANPKGAEYGKFEEGARLPVGSVLAKDSFVVNARGQVVIGVLSLMEKMKAGFNRKVGDWRYTMILPDGAVVGTTGGAGSEKVAFCAGCHVAVDESQGSLYFIPQHYRRGDP